MDVKTPYILCHGSGNSFVMIDAIAEPLPLEEAALPAFARTVCADTSFDVDGLLLLLPDERPAIAARMRMFNPDGSEAEMCGNGLRCAARQVLERTGSAEVCLSTLREIHPSIKAPELAEGVFTVSVTLGEPHFQPADFGAVLAEPLFDEAVASLPGERTYSAVGMPNPHLVSVVDRIDTAELVEAGTALNRPGSLFSEGGNLNFLVDMGNNSIYVATYERGAGLTSSCGSGMTAASVIGCRLGLLHYNQPITVYNDGGFVRTEIERDTGDLNALLVGNASFVAEGDLNYDLQSGKLEFSLHKRQDEIDAYASLVQRVKGAGIPVSG